MKAAFDKTARGEENLGFYEKMKASYDRAKSKGYRFVIAYAADRDMDQYSVALLSRQISDKMAFADLDNYSWTLAQMEPLAVIDTRRPFIGLFDKSKEAEAYFDKPVVNIPEAAKAYPDTKKLFIDKPRRAAFRTIEGGKPNVDI
jgi:hypothetical protein